MPAKKKNELRVTTWNINSVRLRINHVLRLIEEKQPDILCLQEIKCMDELFPLDALRQAGFTHQHVHGQKSYNGVAILSRQPLRETNIHHWAGKEDRRHISARHDSGIEIHNLYVPAGGDIPDPEANVKFRHKLDFVQALTNWSERARYGPDKNRSRILVGDLNIAPGEHDVWSSRKLRDIVSHTEVERKMMRDWIAAGEWTDTARHFILAEEKVYSWWSYRSPNWQTRDLGRRLDHIWASPDLKNTLVGIDHFRDARAWEPQPSDHVPVTLTIQL